MLFIGKYQDLSMFACHGVLESNELVMPDKLALHVLCFKTKEKQNKNVLAGRKLNLTDECFRNLGNFYKSLAPNFHVHNEGYEKHFTRHVQGSNELGYIKHKWTVPNKQSLFNFIIFSF